jgi:hypothetical protein
MVTREQLDAAKDAALKCIRAGNEAFRKLSWERDGKTECERQEAMDAAEREVIEGIVFFVAAWREASSHVLLTVADPSRMFSSVKDRPASSSTAHEAAFEYCSGFFEYIEHDGERFVRHGADIVGHLVPGVSSGQINAEWAAACRALPTQGFAEKLRSQEGATSEDAADTKAVAAPQESDAEKIDRLCSLQTANGSTILRFLFGRKHATCFDSLPPDGFSDGIPDNDDAIVTALRRVRRRLMTSGEFSWTVEISKAKRTVRLDR